ncbi:hypothetical protein D4764_18G0013120 [Takifugu flavidus]|uniref:Uncharacterized protein n=1 Tax=Takifugu flavidus TaxID=433684 RepID=A0A5C6NU39_9TELE|nr:hypothetical protein D4764_18G0013120 [Takifugu flavidus]
MGKEQDLLQAVKSADLQTAHKLLAKLKTNRNSEYLPTLLEAPPSRLALSWRALGSGVSVLPSLGLGGSGSSSCSAHLVRHRSMAALTCPDWSVTQFQVAPLRP